MDKKAQVQIMGLISIFIFAIVATALLPTLGDSIDTAEKDYLFVNTETLGNMTANNTEFSLTNTPYSAETAHAPVLMNQSTTFTVSATLPCTAPCYYLVGGYATGNITVNGTELDGNVTWSIMYINYTYYGDSPNMSSTDRAMLDLWPTFIVIGGLLAILGAAGLRG